MSGMFGIGGGAVRIPLLNLVGLPLLSAFGINLFIAGLIPTLILALLFVALSLVIVLGLFLDRIAPVLTHKFHLTPKSAFASSFFLSLMAAIRGGSAVSLKTKSVWLEMSLGILIVALALITVYKTL